MKTIASASRFTDSLNVWLSSSFNNTLKQELKNLKPGTLPLSKATTQGGMIDDSEIAVSIINTQDSGNLLQIKTGIFFSEIIGGCSCGDEPYSENAYGVILVSINKQTAETEFILLEDED